MLASAILHAAFAGFLAAAAVDFQAFRAWKNFNEITQYDWGTAIFRWAQGAALGILSAYVFTTV